MEFINKNNQSIFLPHYTSFESRKWNTVLNEYSNYIFLGLKGNLKNLIKFSLIDEQNHRCCYCMRKLEKDDTTTIEHLYPNNPQAHNEFANYNLQCTEKSRFIYTTQQIPNATLTNLPHDISYYNLLACCGKCNNTRGNKEIMPFVFDINVKTQFDYNADGNIYSQNYSNEITQIGLANDFYVNYRKLWKRIASKHNSTIFLDQNKLKKIIQQIALELHLEIRGDLFFINFANNGLYINEALSYQYFFYP